MPPTARKPAKSETLTIRLDPKTRFILEFMSRLNGQTITTIVERAIIDAASRAPIDPSNNDERTWQNFWDVNEGVRSLLLASQPRLYPTFEEERRLDFANKHDAFFFKNGRPRSGYIEILWPRIDEFVALWDETKTSDYFASGKAMRSALLAAGVEPPEWPPVANTSAKQNSNSSYAADLDDDIPF
jgi:hypothetical protein